MNVPNIPELIKMAYDLKENLEPSVEKVQWDMRYKILVQVGQGRTAETWVKSEAEWFEEKGFIVTSASNIYERWYIKMKSGGEAISNRISIG